MAIDTVNSLTTLEEMKVWIAVKSTDTSFDAIIENFIDSVSWQFNKLTNRLLKARAITGQYDGDGTSVLMLPQFPINSITSIHIDDDRVFGASTAVTDYVFYADGTVKLDDNVFSKVAQANKIVYNAGYSTIPYDLVVACKDQVKWLVRRWRDNMEGRTIETTINGSVTMTEAGEMLTSSMEIVKRYMRVDHV